MDIGLLNKKLGDYNLVKVDYGIASVYADNQIEIHNGLDYYPDLKNKILSHEVSHSIGSNFSYNDFKNDFLNKTGFFFELIKFCKHYPSGIINFFPIMYSYERKQISFSQTYLIFWSMMFLLPSFIVDKITDFGFWKMWGIFFIFILIINFFIILFTHLNIKRNKKRKIYKDK